MSLYWGVELPRHEMSSSSSKHNIRMASKPNSNKSQTRCPRCVGPQEVAWHTEHGTLPMVLRSFSRPPEVQGSDIDHEPSEESPPEHPGTALEHSFFIMCKILQYNTILSCFICVTNTYIYTHAIHTHTFNTITWYLHAEV